MGQEDRNTDISREVTDMAPVLQLRCGAALITQTFGFLSGFIGYYRRRLIDFALAGRILRVAVPVGVAGALTATYVHDSILLAGYALLVATLAFVMWRNKPPANSASSPT